MRSEALVLVAAQITALVPPADMVLYATGARRSERARTSAARARIRLLDYLLNQSAKKILLFSEDFFPSQLFCAILSSGHRCSFSLPSGSG
jgi:hypothetical protein